MTNTAYDPTQDEQKDMAELLEAMRVVRSYSGWGSLVIELKAGDLSELEITYRDDGNDDHRWSPDHPGEQEDLTVLLGALRSVRARGGWGKITVAWLERDMLTPDTTYRVKPNLKHRTP